MKINLIGFATTAAIGLPLLGLIVWIMPVSRTKDMFLAIAGSAAIAPTIWAPFETYYVEAASIVCFAALVSVVEPLGFLIGGGPIVVLAAIIYAALRRFRMREAGGGT